MQGVALDTSRQNWHTWNHNLVLPVLSNIRHKTKVERDVECNERITYLL